MEEFSFLSIGLRVKGLLLSPVSVKWKESSSSFLRRLLWVCQKYWLQLYRGRFTFFDDWVSATDGRNVLRDLFSRCSSQGKLALILTDLSCGRTTGSRFDLRDGFQGIHFICDI